MKTTPIETVIRRLVERHSLSRIEITTQDGRSFTAVAYPAPWHQVVVERRQAAFAAAGKTDFTIAEAQAIGDKAASDALCQETADTIADAVEALRKAISTRAREVG